MPGFTNKGKWHLLKQVFQNPAEPTNYYVALVTSAVAPTAATNTFGQLTQINTNTGGTGGYQTGGFQLARNATDFDTADGEDDGNSRGYIQIKDVFWTHATESIPNGGSGARYAVLTDDNVTVGSREVIAFWDLTSDRSVSATQTLTLQNCELRLNET